MFLNFWLICELEMVGFTKATIASMSMYPDEACVLHVYGECLVKDADLMGHEASS